MNRHLIISGLIVVVLKVVGMTFFLLYFPQIFNKSNDGFTTTRSYGTVSQIFGSSSPSPNDFIPTTSYGTGFIPQTSNLILSFLGPLQSAPKTGNFIKKDVFSYLLLNHLGMKAGTFAKEKDPHWQLSTRQRNWYTKFHFDVSRVPQTHCSKLSQLYLTLPLLLLHSKY
ncbi:C-type lectin domain family 5 member A isoform X5 [Papio anubis]|uniref:C-type lectin domain family 5 member A isoform X5 n=1 Tax=Papio anubis TaxID=9555 RepID=UPI0012AE85A2|nr:C-type lectin domain family 5 member A isoform X5 [Papio anubis]